MKTDIDICGRQAVAGSALIEFGNPLLQEAALRQASSVAAALKIASVRQPLTR
jgi:hypothetical protein